MLNFQGVFQIASRNGSEFIAVWHDQGSLPNLVAPASSKETWWFFHQLLKNVCLVVGGKKTHLKNMSQNGNLPQMEVKIKKLK